MVEKELGEIEKLKILKEISEIKGLEELKKEYEKTLDKMGTIGVEYIIANPITGEEIINNANQFEKLLELEYVEIQKRKNELFDKIEQKQIIGLTDKIEREFQSCYKNKRKNDGNNDAVDLLQYYISVVEFSN